MDNLNTTDSILSALEKMAANKEPIDAHQWLEGGMKLLALLGNEQNNLYTLEHTIAVKKAFYVENGCTAAKAKIMVEAAPEYLEAKILKAKVERSYEIIKMCKLYSRLSNDEVQFQR